ncbi:MAG: hypothetical protein N2Z80_03105 [Hydrogenothermaceae bacterium]|nr:hypothetical protein [Hydrogenothermaceae bacterium]
MTPGKSIGTVDDFIDAVLEYDQRTAGMDFGNREHSLEIVKTLFRMIKNYVSDEEIQDLKGDLLRHLKTLLD